MEFPETSVGKKANEPIGVTQVPVTKFVVSLNDASPKSLTKANLRKFEANVPNGADYDVWLPLASVHEVNDRMKNSLYEYFIGKRLAFPVVEWFVRNNCEKYVLKKVTMVKGFFLFKFASIEGVEYVLYNGPWMIRGIPIFLNKWSLSVSLLKEELSHIPVWVKFHDVPLVAYTSDGLSLMGTKIVNSPKVVPKQVVNQNDKGKGQTSGVDDEGFIEVTKKEIGCNSYEALDDENLIIEEAATGSIATTSGTQEEGQSFTPIVDKINVLEKQILEGKLVLVDDARKPQKKVDYPVNLGNDDEVEPVDNEMTSFLVSKPIGVGYGQEIPDNIQTICDNLDIKEDTTAGKEKGFKASFKEDSNALVCSGHFKNVDTPKTGGSMLLVIEDLIKVGQTMGYKMEGLAHKAKKDWVKELCYNNKVNFLALQETKMEQVDLFNIKSCWGNLTFDFVVGPSVGNSGGILCVWDPNMFHKENFTISDYFIAIMGKWIPNDKKMLIISVYAPQELAEKKMLWQYLKHLIDRWKGDVIVMGDFNEVRSEDERFGSIFNDRGAAAFNSFISSGGLVEVPSGGYSFTWSHKSASKMSKLDRFLISEDLMRTCPNISSLTLDRYLSNHRPILLRELNLDYGPTPFWFFHHWFELEGFDSFMADTWRDIYVSESNAMLKMKELKNKLADIDSSLDKRNVTSATLDDRMSIMNNLNSLVKLESIELAQKAKVKWSIEGDENSNYYHGIINKQRKNLAIRGIIVDGEWIEDPKAVKNEFLSHFKDRFDNPCDSRLILDMDFPNKLSSDEIHDLERTFSKEEIKGAVWDCGLNKSPDPDGFTFGFYRRFWSLIEDDVVAAVNHFFNFGFCPKGGNSSFIALIPKTQGAKMVKDFRPISLIGSLYKIIAKLLANRLMSVMGNLVNEVQSAFIASRQILEGPFILNEIIHWCKAKKKQSMIFKVDFEKAFDSVRWDFLDDVLKKFGFGSRWCTWIQSCLKSSRGSIRVNGSPTPEFQFYKDSLLQLSHLFYADDVVFIGQWCDSNLTTIIRVLDCFFCASGLRINLHKSKLMGIAVENSLVDLAANGIGCMTLKLLFQYLGVNIGGNMSRINSWDDVINKVHRRLSKWKMKTLSIGGRLTLLKSVLGSMPIYYMSMFKVPIHVLKKLESIRSHFFNGVDPNVRKMTFVKWDHVLASKEKGGLGVSSLYALNRALIFKWVWRFRTQNLSLWSRVIKAIHGDNDKISIPHNSSISSNWMDIIREMHLLKTKGIDLLGSIKKKLGNGENTSFWEETWKGEAPFKILFPRIFALESDKSISVAAKMAHSSFGFSLRSIPRGGIEQHQMEELLSNLEGLLLPNMLDRWFWSHSGDGDFSVSSTRNFIDNKTIGVVGSKTRWCKYVPIKVNILSWRIKMDNLPTRLNLSRRGMDLESIFCPSCDLAVESTSHIFFSYSMMKDLYKNIDRWWDINMRVLSSYEEWQVWFSSLRLSSKLKLILEGVFYITWWSTWNYRNKSIFGSNIPSKARLFDDIVALSFTWCRARSKLNFSWVDWLKNLSLISL
ncbi:RNA-directed DNA polymerase, eukaryota [Tanacetum coccineum]